MEIFITTFRRRVCFVALCSTLLLLLGFTPPPALGAPMISAIPDQRTFPGLPMHAVAFVIGDENPAITNLSLRGASSNQTLVPDQNIAFGGSGSNRTVTLTPLPGGTGTAAITVTVENPQGQTANTTFLLRVADFSEVAAGFEPLFYGALIWVDYDNDGFLDLFTSGFGLSLVPRTALYHNNGNGVFTRVQTPFPDVGGASADWADYDNDGLSDLIIAGWTPNGPPVQVFHNDGNGQFTLSATFGSYRGITSVAWGDINNDGRVDAVVGQFEKASVYRNNGDGTFTETSAGLPLIDYESVSFTDFDGDGWQDIFSFGDVTKLFRNNRNGTFSDTSLFFPASVLGNANWGDYNNDKKPDLLFCGTPGQATCFASVYRNDGSSFKDLGLGLPGFRGSGGAWGDFDNDGNLDFFVSGDTNLAQYFAGIYHNQGQDAFSMISFVPPGTTDTLAAWGDYDNDGALDLAIMGDRQGSPMVSKLYHNDGAMPNKAPSTPTGLSVTVLGNSALLSWNEASDAEQSGGLSYNVRIGTSPNSINILSPLANLTNGYRRVARIGNAGYRSSFLITNLAAGTYYWSVQAIDNAFAGSLFAPEQSFSLQAPFITNQPLSQILPVGSNVIFSVGLEGSQPFGFQWFFNGSKMIDNTRFFGSATASLSISNLQTSDSGAYQVVVTNLFGSATSTVAQLTVQVPPSVTKQPVGRSVPAGYPTTFSATGSGTAISYQWQLNGVNIPDATNSSFSLPTVNSTNLGVYRLMVSNAVGVAFSAAAQLTFGPVVAWGRNDYGECLPPPGLDNVIAIAGGSSHSLALRSDGTVVAWGTGSGTNVPSTLSNVVAISGGGGGLALLADGSVVGWGYIAGKTPVPASLSNMIAVAAGYSASLALRREGTAVTWADYVTPVPQGLTKLSAIAAGGNALLALQEDGAVAEWPVSRNPDFLNYLSPEINDVKDIAAGWTTGFALKSDGTMAAWGNPNGKGTKVPPGISNIAAISAGFYPQGQEHCLALLSNGVVVAWGDNFSGETNTPAGLTNAISVAGGAYHSLALIGDGRPVITRPPVGGTGYKGRDFILKGRALGRGPLSYQWFFNGMALPGKTNSILQLSNLRTEDAGNYQLAASNSLSTATSIPVPVTVVDNAPFILTPLTNLTANLASKAVMDIPVSGSGPLQYQWRFNGQDLSNATASELVFERVRMTNTGSYILVASNDFGAITSAVCNLTVRQVVGWGASSYNLTNTPNALTNAAAVAIMNYQALGLRTDGTVLGWGLDTYGQNNVAKLTNVVEMALGSPLLALRTDGNISVCGTPSVVFSNAIVGLSNVISVEADGWGITGLRTDGSITRINSSGTLIGYGLTNAVALFSFNDGFAALLADGTIFASGSGTHPPAETDVLALALERYNGALLKRDGTLRTWGNPSINGSFTNFLDVSPFCAVQKDGKIMAWGANIASNVPPWLRNVIAVDSAVSAVSLALLADRDFPLVNLPDALDTPELVVSSRFSPRWFGQTNVTHDGVDAAQSAPIDKNTSSSMRMWVTGPVTINFWWRVSSETNHDFLTFSAGGIPMASISGETGWQEQSIDLPEGNQILVWTYSKDSSGSEGQDTAWVDQVKIVPQLPRLLLQPSSQQVAPGTNVTLVASATGTPPLAYKWYKNNVEMFPFGSSSLTLTSVHRADSGLYKVAVKNKAGTVYGTNVLVLVRLPQNLSVPTILSNGMLYINAADAEGNLSNSDLGHFSVQSSTNLTSWETVPDALGLTNGMLYLSVPKESFKGPTEFYRIVESW